MKTGEDVSFYDKLIYDEETLDLIGIRDDATGREKMRFRKMLEEQNNPVIPKSVNLDDYTE